MIRSSPAIRRLLSVGSPRSLRVIEALEPGAGRLQSALQAPRISVVARWWLEKAGFLALQSRFNWGNLRSGGPDFAELGTDRRQMLGAMRAAAGPATPVKLPSRAER